MSWRAREWIAVAVAVVAMAGCARQPATSSGPPSLLGDWTNDEQKAGQDIGSRFRSDGTCDWWAGDSRINWRNRGTYTLVGDRLTMVAIDAEVTLESKKTTEASQSGRSFHYTVRWPSPNKMQWSDGGKTVSYTRR